MGMLLNSFVCCDELADAFQLVVKTDNTGTSNDDQFTLPLKAAETYDCTIYWGDGTTTAQSTDSSPTHTYAAGAGTYTVSVSGTFPAVYFNVGGDRLKVLELKNWGTQAWTTFFSAFNGAMTWPRKPPSRTSRLLPRPTHNTSVSAASVDRKYCRSCKSAGT